MKEELLRRKMKKVYKKIKFEFEDYNCGHNMLLNISSKYYNYCVKFNRIADKLSKTDSNCPDFRYELS